MCVKHESTEKLLEIMSFIETDMTQVNSKVDKVDWRNSVQDKISQSKTMNE